MGRPKKLDDSQMLELVKKYYVEICHSEPIPSLLKFSKIGKYIRDQGIDIGDHLLRENEGVRNFINSLYSGVPEYFDCGLAYHDFDPELFLRNNPTRDQLIKSLFDLDNYYKRIYLAAAYNRNRVLSFETVSNKRTEECKTLSSEKSELISENENLKKELTLVKSELRECQLIIKRYKHLLKDKVYPEIANNILFEEKLLKETKSLNKTLKKQEVVNASSNIQEIVDSIKTNDIPRDDKKIINNNVIHDLFKNL